MPLYAKEESGHTFEPVAEGCHMALCYGVVDIGTQMGQWEGKPKEDRKVIVMFELPDERITVERDGVPTDLPRAISKQYTLSLGKKATLCKDLVGWRGKAFTPDELKRFDIEKLLGCRCQLMVVHKPSKDGSKTWANIQSIMAVPKGIAKVGSTENPTLFWSFDDWDKTKDNSVFPENMPEWVVNKCRQSKEWNAVYDGPEDEVQKAPDDDRDDSAMPF